jgi:hypothetical protein
MKRLLPLLTVLALVFTACGASHKSALPIRSVHQIAAARERRAGRTAERLLGQVVLPPGAIPFRRLPAGSSVLLRSGLGVSVLTEFADRHAFWSVRLPLASVDSFVKAHPTAGLKWGSGGSSGGPGAANVSEDFYGPLVGGRPIQRLLSITAARIGERTVIRVDAGAAWVYPRSPREVIPASVHEIDIANSAVSRRVTSPAQVARIIQWFDALNIVQPGSQVLGCPLILASKVTFTFRSASGAELAKAAAFSQPADGCDPIEFTIRGHRQTPLIDSALGEGKAFVDRVQRLLGVRFAQRP